MARHISLIQLYEDNREKLMLNWVIGQRIDRRVEIKAASNYGADVVGHINIVHPERMQVMGQAEYDWAVRIGEGRFAQHFKDLLLAEPPAVIIADGLTPPDSLVSACTASDTPVILSPKPCSAVIDLLRQWVGQGRIACIGLVFADSAPPSTDELDEALLTQLAKNHEVLITIEEGSVGGFGAFVLHSLAGRGLLDAGLRIRTLTLPDIFQDHDTPEKMYEQAGLDARSIAASAIKALGRGDERALKLIAG